jgi:hypothetical protein
MLRRTNTIAAIAACALTFGTSAAFAGTTTYDFSAVSGQSTPASIGIATFNSSADIANTLATGLGEYTFGANGNLYTALGAYVLAEAGGFSGSSLTINFTVAQDAIRFDYAIGDFFALNGSDTLTVTASDGSTVTSTNAAIPAGSGDLYPQGTVSLTSATGFTSVTIAATDAAGPETLTIADLTTVPEPATLSILGAGIAGLAGLRRRRA